MVVGSLPQPDWLIGPQRQGHQLPPRVRAAELWLVPAQLLPEAQDDATLAVIRARERPGSTSSPTARWRAPVQIADVRAPALAYADVVREEIADLFAAGADIVQPDEPWLQARPDVARRYGG